MQETASAPKLAHKHRKTVMPFQLILPGHRLSSPPHTRLGQNTSGFANCTRRSNGASEAKLLPGCLLISGENSGNMAWRPLKLPSVAKQRPDHKHQTMGSPLCGVLAESCRGWRMQNKRKRKPPGRWTGNSDFEVRVPRASTGVPTSRRAAP